MARAFPVRPLVDALLAADDLRVEVGAAGEYRFARKNPLSGSKLGADNRFPFGKKPLGLALKYGEVRRIGQ